MKNYSEIKKILLLTPIAILLLFFQNFTQVNEISLAINSENIVYKLTQLNDGTATTSSDKITVKNISYASSNSAKDLCVDKTELCFDIIHHPTEVRPLVVFVHGGGWKGGSYKGHVDQIGKTFYDAGYAFASVGYRSFSSSVPIKTLVTDAAAGIALINNNSSLFKIKKSIVIIGHSAGAHMTALMASHPDILNQVGLDRESIKGVVLLDGSVYDFKALKGKQNGVLSQATNDPKVWDDLSPAYNVIKSNLMPPTYMASDIARDLPDEGKYPGTGEQANILKKAMLSKKSPLRHRTFPKKSHEDYLHDLKVDSNELTKDILKFISFVQPEVLTNITQSKTSSYLSPLVFDWRVYFTKNKDSFVNLDYTESNVKKHWLDRGLHSGLASQSGFDLKKLFLNYPNLARSLNNNYASAVAYYAQYGHWLGYRAVPDAHPFGGLLPDDKTASPFGNSIIGNDRIKVVTTAKYAGAVTELWFKNKQIVNSGAKGYGRLFQVAAWKFGLDACFNPIEAGGRYLADRQETTKTVIHNLTAEPGIFENSVTPSLFRKKGEDLQLCQNLPNFSMNKLPNENAEIDNDIIFGKKIELNAFGNPNIIRFEVKVKSLIDVENFKFQLYAALNLDMNQIYSVNINKCKRSNTPEVDCSLALRSDLGSSKYSTNFPAILSTKNNSVAFAFYSPLTAMNSPAEYSAEHRSGDGDQGTVDTAVSFKMPFMPNGEVSVPIYVFVGSKATVQESYTWGLKNITK